MKPDKRLIGTYTPINDEVEARQAYEKAAILGYRNVGIYRTDFPRWISFFSGTAENGELEGRSVEFSENFGSVRQTLPLADLLAMEPEGNADQELLDCLEELTEACEKLTSTAWKPNVLDKAKALIKKHQTT